MEITKTTLPVGTPLDKVYVLLSWMHHERDIALMGTYKYPASQVASYCVDYWTMRISEESQKHGVKYPLHN